LDIRISGRHVAVTDAMRDHARERLAKIERYSAHIMHIEVTLSIQAERHMAEMLVAFRRRGDVVARSETHDMYQAIDKTIAKIEKQLHRLEDRVKDKREGSRQKRDMEQARLSVDMEDEAEVEDA